MPRRSVASPPEEPPPQEELQERVESFDAVELLPVDRRGEASSAEVRLNGLEGHGDASDGEGRPWWGARRRWISVCGCVVATVLVLPLLVAAVRSSYLRGERDASVELADADSPAADAQDFHGISRIAFGSCTSYDTREITIFETGIIPTEPDAWIWLGDIVYMDSSSINCATHPDHPDCTCDSSFLGGPPTQCFVGDLDHARDKVVRFVDSPAYQGFLEYMCPNHTARSAVVPTGADPSQCRYPILGTYDDHDSGWNNGNRRMPQKHAFKNLFLDALGEPAGSTRRSMVQGLQDKVTLNPGTQGREIDVFLLDERFHRSPLPCRTNTRYCNGVLGDDPTFDGTRSNKTVAWCQDFLLGGPLGKGTCCKRDDELFHGWCEQHRAAKQGDPEWREACDPTYSEYGRRNLVVREGKLREADPTSARDILESSQLCEVLGYPQRQWLRAAIQASRAPLKLVASGSVVLAKPNAANSEDALPHSARQQCSGDDWDCYRAAQLSLLHTLGSATTGCVVILTGDYHFADMKVLQPGGGQPYSDSLQTEKLSRPMYQVMSSGMSDLTAFPTNDAEHCSSYRVDEDGLRPDGRCSLYTAPNFGMVEVDWDSNVATLSIRDANGQVAHPADASLPALEYRVDLHTCELLRD